jgi:hypothetical protein
MCNSFLWRQKVLGQMCSIWPWLRFDRLHIDNIWWCPKINSPGLALHTMVISRTQPKLFAPIDVGWVHAMTTVAAWHARYIWTSGCQRLQMQFTQFSLRCKYGKEFAAAILRYLISPACSAPFLQLGSAGARSVGMVRMVNIYRQSFAEHSKVRTNLVYIYVW